MRTRTSPIAACALLSASLPSSTAMAEAPSTETISMFATLISRGGLDDLIDSVPVSPDNDDMGGPPGKRE